MAKSFFSTKQRIDASTIALSVSCDHCGAQSGEPCISESGRRAMARWRPMVHVARREASARRFVVAQFAAGGVPKATEARP